MVSFATDRRVANPQGLKDIAAADRLTGMINYIDLLDQTNALVAGTLPEFSFKYVPYIFDASSVLVENPPAVYRPTGDSGATPLGAYTMMNDPFILSTVRPSDPPEMPNTEWRAALTNPTRVAIWRSPKFLPATPTAENWVGDTTPIILNLGIAANGFPNFDADFAGQRIQDETTGLIFRALNAFNDNPPTKWVLDMPDFVKIDTVVLGIGDIIGDFTIEEKDHLQFRSLTDSAIATLPSGITERIRIKLSHFEATAGTSTSLTLRPGANTTLNGGNSDVVTPPNNNYVIYNYGNDWFAE